MSLSTARCMFRTILSRKPTNTLYITFVTLQCHKFQPKWSYLNLPITSPKPLISFTTKRHVNITSSLKMSKNYYDVLGVPKDANPKQIKDAYYKLAMKHHPDKNQGKLTQQFREIKEAYDILSNESSRTNYNKSSSTNNNYTTYSNKSSNSSSDHYRSRQEYTSWKNTRTEYSRPNRGNNYDYSQLRPFNVFINVIRVPKNVVKTHVDIMLLTFIKNRTLKLILFQLFQFVWSQMLKNLNFNVLISTSYGDSLTNFLKSILVNNTIRIELTEMEALKGKAVRVQVNDNEQVLVVNIPRGTIKDQSFYLFYLIDDDNDNKASFKL